MSCRLAIPENLREDGIWKPARWRNRVEALANLRDAVMLDEGPVAEFPAHDHRRNQRKTGAFAGEQTQHRHIIHLRGDDRPDVMLFEQQIERCADIAIEAREHERRLAQVVGKLEFPALARWLPDETHGLFIQQMTVPRCFGVASHGEIGKHDIQGMGTEPCEQVAQIA